MPQVARIKIASKNLQSLEQVVKEIREVADKSGVKIVGPIPLPTKRLKIATQKNPSGEGTITWDKFEVRIHKRLIYLDASRGVMKNLMRIRIPDDVYISLDLLNV
ncbi:30S ribosomal protein S10 [Candidatus Bathyarchaeota archaeon ex4484_205]|nr:MAG: 30S ribosomal protein S10 [Candidatus Bathyarchaeota archaeon ex4484_205]RLG67698.1 MAG: 30S ribosomal protein S10 [archaeon]HDN17458.1 30S ribosomal protein S10 [Candidatus Bathyarchaeota archaeon]